MRFFTGQRGGELASRLTNDTAAAAAGLETIVGTILSAPVLIGFYGVLLFRTSPRLVPTLLPSWPTTCTPSSTMPGVLPLAVQK